MTRTELEAAVYEETGYQATPDSRVVTRIRRWLVEGVRAVLGEPGLQLFDDSDAPYTFASVVGQPRYSLPAPIARLHHLTDRTNDRRLTPMPKATYRRIDPDAATSSGTPTHYVPWGRVAVAKPPDPTVLGGVVLLAVSTSASDVGAVTVVGLLADGTTQTVTVTMTGVTQASFGLSTWVDVQDWYLSVAAVGIVSLMANPNPVSEIARIGPGATRASYTAIYLWPTPSAVITYYADYRRTLLPLATATSVPPWPVDFHELLVAYAGWREWTFKGDGGQAEAAQIRYRSWLARLKYSTQVQPDAALVMGRRQYIGHSRLGPWYPADTWSRW